MLPQQQQQRQRHKAVGYARAYGSCQLGVVRPARCFEGVLGQDLEGSAPDDVCRSAQGENVPKYSKIPGNKLFIVEI